MGARFIKAASHAPLVINCLPTVNYNRCEGGGVACLATPSKNNVARATYELLSGYVVFMYISNPGNASNVRLDPKLAQCRTSVYDVVPTSNQHKLYVLRLPIIHIYKYIYIYAFTHGPERKHTQICLYKYVQNEIYQTVLNS